MKRNVIFVIVFAAVIIGLVKLHECSTTSKSKWTIMAIDEVVSIGYPNGIRERSDIPFELLLDNEYKKSLPESTNYDQYRPTLIFLAEDFNEQDSTQLQSFANIVVNVRNAQPLDYTELAENAKLSVLENIRTTTENSIKGTSYQIIKWNELDSYPIGNGIAFKASFVKQNEVTHAFVTSIVTYLFDKNREVEIVLSAPGTDVDRWGDIYNKMVDSIIFN